MSKKFIVRVSAMILCATMLVTSLTVLAETRKETVPLGGSGSGTIFSGITHHLTVYP